MRHFIEPSGLTHFVWVVPGFIVVAVFAIIVSRFLLRLPARPRNMFVLAGITYVTGALGFEMIGGYLSGPNWEAGTLTLTDHLIMTVEEGLEMFGIVLLVYALLLQVASTWNEVPVELKLVEPDPLPTPEKLQGS